MTKAPESDPTIVVGTCTYVQPVGRQKLAPLDPRSGIVCWTYPCTAVVSCKKRLVTYFRAFVTSCLHPPAEWVLLYFAWSATSTADMARVKSWRRQHVRGLAFPRTFWFGLVVGARRQLPCRTCMATHLSSTSHTYDAAMPL